MKNQNWHLIVIAALCIITVLQALRGGPNICASVTERNGVDHSVTSKEDEDSDVMAQPPTIIKKEKPNLHRIVWMIQGKAEGYARWRKRVDGFNGDVVLIYHSFDQDCDGCLFRTGTSYMTGSNILIKAALALEDIKYYVRSDDDITMTCDDHKSESRCWKSYNDMLLAADSTAKPIISPKLPHEAHLPKVDSYESCVDISLWAMTKEYLPVVFPVSTYKPDNGWNIHIHGVWYLFERCGQCQLFSTAAFTVSNPMHTGYPQEYDNEKLALRIANLMNTEYGEIGPWVIDPDHITFDNCRRCNAPPEHYLFDDGVRNEHGRSSHPECAAFLNRRFEKWVARGMPQESMLTPHKPITV